MAPSASNAEHVCPAVRYARGVQRDSYARIDFID